MRTEIVADDGEGERGRLRLKPAPDVTCLSVPPRQGVRPISAKTSLFHIDPRFPQQVSRLTENETAEVNPVKKQAQTIDLVVPLVSTSPYSLSRHDMLVRVWCAQCGSSVSSRSPFGGLLDGLDIFRWPVGLVECDLCV